LPRRTVTKNRAPVRATEHRTDGRTVTEADVVFFSYFTGDWTYLHTDAVAARQSVFGERIAHGPLSLAISLGLLVRSGVVDPKRFVALRSIEQVRFRRPVRIGDTLHVRFVRSERSQDQNRVEMTLRATTFNQRDEAVMEFTTVAVEKGPTA